MAPADRHGRGDPHHRVARAEARLRTRRACRRRHASTATRTSSTARSGTSRSRARPTSSSCSPARRTASTCSSSTRRAAGVTLTQQLTIASDAQYEVELLGRVGPGREPHRRRRHRLGDVARDDARRHRAARRVRDGRRPLRARHRRSSTPRTASSSTSRSARSRPSPTTWPTRRPRSTAARSSCTRRPGPAPTATPIDRLAPMAKLFACQTFRDVTADGPPGPRRHGLHGRVRHAALLPPGQGAADLLVERPLPRGARSPPPPSTATTPHPSATEPDATCSALLGRGASVRCRRRPRGARR